ncbi:MAG: protein kinase [Pyrinomonadaceae bacterium]
MATETIIGNYRIEERIGRGGMGVVFRGHHTTLPREVAIKSINPHEHSDLRRLRTRFEKEAYIQSQLDHSGIVKIYDYIVAEDIYYIVMEYVQGRSLADLCASDECPLEVDRALDIFEQILEAVAFAHSFVYMDQEGVSHSGLIHRDLKPANIMVTPDDKVKVTDFGIVKLMGAENTDTTGISYGTPQYVSPEQAEGAPVDQRSDIYSLGIILYEMLTGGPPFGNDTDKLSRTEILRAHMERAPRTPSEINDEIEPELDGLILRALDKKAEKRFKTAKEFLRAVYQLRGRDTARLGAKEKTKTRAIRAASAEEAGSKEKATARQGYITQPLGSSVCASCGADVTPRDKHCRKCGHVLSASIATAKLTQLEAAEWRERRRRAVWIVSALGLLLLLSLIIIYARRGVAPTSNANSSTNATPSESTPNTTPASALVELKPARVSVDSSFDGYSAAPLTDGQTDVREIGRMRYNKGNWASAETPVEHWIELSFDKPARVAAIYVYWGYDRDRFMPSRRVELQNSLQGDLNIRNAWTKISEVEPGRDYDRTAFEFAPTITSRLRILQPAQQGPTNRPFVMWVREVKVYGVSDENQAR